MGVVRVALDQHTLDRLEALALLRRELDPRSSLDAQEALRQAVERGLDVLLREALAEPRRTWERRRPPTAMEA